MEENKLTINPERAKEIAIILYEKFNLDEGIFETKIKGIS